MSEPVFNSDGRCLCGHVSMVEQVPAFVQLSRDSPSRLRPQGEVVWIPGARPRPKLKPRWNLHLWGDEEA